MTRIIADPSLPLDGFATGPGPDNGLGTGGEGDKPAFAVVTNSPPESPMGGASAHPAHDISR
jgi:hypothetical protein